MIMQYHDFMIYFKNLQETEELDKMNFDIILNTIKHTLPADTIITKMEIKYNPYRDYNELYLTNTEGLKKWWMPRYLRQNMKMYFY